MTNLKCKFKLFRDQNGRSRDQHMGRDPLFADPWCRPRVVVKAKYSIGVVLESGHRRLLSSTFLYTKKRPLHNTVSYSYDC